MVKKYVDKRTKRFFNSPEELGKEDAAQITKAVSWKGRINVLNPQKSEIAEKIGIDTKGEYAIKVR